MRPAMSRAATAAAVALVCAAATFTVFAAQPADAADDQQWTMGGQNISNTRSNPSETILSPSSVGGLTLNWSYTTRGDVSATPAVVDGAVYFPDWGGYFHKVDANTGAVIWSRAVSSYVGAGGTVVSRTSPVVVGNTVYIGTQTGARVLAIDTATGNLRWNTQADTHPDAILTGGAVYYNGVLYEGVSSLEFSHATEAGYDCCTFRGSLVAIDAATGALKWKSYTLPDQGPGGDIYSGASVWGTTPSIDPASNSIFIGTGQNYSVPQSVEQCQANGGTPAQCLASWNRKDSIVAMDLTTGAIKWATGPARFDVWNFACLQGPSPQNCPNPGPDHDTGEGTHLFDLPGPNGTTRRAVMAGQKSGDVWMLDAATGEIIWGTSVGPGSTQGGIEWGTANDGQRIFFTESNAGNESHRLPNGQTINYSSFGALDARTGQILWQVPEPHGGRSIGPVTYANGVVYVGSMNNWMYALNANNGQVLWQYQGAGSSNAGPAIVGGKLYWGNGYARGGTASTRFYSFRVPGSPTTSPTVSPTTSPTTSPTVSPTVSPTLSPTNPPAGACSATYSIVNQWPGGFQAEVIVRAGSKAINGWSLQWSFANGQTISQFWNATMTTSGASVTSRNVSFNGALPANGSTNFGFLGSWNGANAIPAPITCTAT
ncbi:PQQ-binding-like beta-propeller repeat protein [Micromonospora sp. NPDC093277]|uniref:outer membrane protein assembly factor BamB family protein n=1 Tax=Micromonospora sp. NPDC093277 TaxID=3364291 RepID=UPI0038277881